jgi:hypothetical protein
VAGRGDELVGRYRWLTEPWPTGFGEAGCLTVVVAADTATVLDAFAAEPNERIPIEDAALIPTPHVALADAGGALVAVELNGYEGSRPEVLARGSRRGKAASVYWEINGMVIVSCATRGRVVASVDLSVDTEDTDLPARLRAMLSSADDDLVALGGAMVERYTGIAIGPGSFERLPEAYVVYPRPEERDVEDPDRASLRYEYPQLVAGIVSADQAVRRRLAQWCAEQALGVVGLAAEQAVREVTGQFGEATVPHQTFRFTQYSARIDRDEQRAEAAYRREESRDDWSIVRAEREARLMKTDREYQRAIRRNFALAAVEYACQNDSVSAALGSVDSTLYSVAPGTAREALADKVAELLAHPDPDWPRDVSWLPSDTTD